MAQPIDFAEFFQAKLELLLGFASSVEEQDRCGRAKQIVAPLVTTERYKIQRKLTNFFPASRVAHNLLFPSVGLSIVIARV